MKIISLAEANSFKGGYLQERLLVTLKEASFKEILKLRLKPISFHEYTYAGYTRLITITYDLEKALFTVELSKDPALALSEDLFTSEGLDTRRQMKAEELASEVNRIIDEGVDVLTTKGQERFTLTISDRLTLQEAVNELVIKSRTLFRASGQPFRLFSREEVMAVNKAALRHIKFHQICLSFYQDYLYRLNTEEELAQVNYGGNLPDDLISALSDTLGRMEGKSFG